MADITKYTIEQLEQYLAAKKTVAAVEGKPVKAPAKVAKPKPPTTAKAKGKRKPMSDAAKKALSKAATARWKAAKKAGKKHL